jgi:hypothetical protein
MDKDLGSSDFMGYCMINLHDQPAHLPADENDVKDFWLKLTNMPQFDAKGTFLNDEKNRGQGIVYLLSLNPNYFFIIIFAGELHVKVQLIKSDKFIKPTW